MASGVFSRWMDTPAITPWPMDAGRKIPWDLPLCWARWRRDLFDINQGGSAPIAAEILNRIAALYRVETEIRGRSAEERRAARQVRTVPLIDDLFRWLEQKLPLLPQSGKMAEIIRYGVKRRDGLTRFLHDGTIEIDNNAVERAIRPITLNRKNALFAGHDEGAAAWGLIASLIETCWCGRFPYGIAMCQGETVAGQQRSQTCLELT